MKTNGHLPVLLAVVASLLYLAIPAPKIGKAGKAPPPDGVPAPATPVVAPPGDPKFGAGTTAMRGPTWKPEGFDFRMKIPQGWTEHERRGRPILSRDVADPRAGNVCVISLPNFFGLDLDGLLAENERELTDNPAFEMDRAQKLSYGGKEVVRVDYHGLPADTEEELHFVCLMYLRGTQTVAITVTGRETAWPEFAESVERSLASVRFDAP
jgi:hypothetical protein